MVVGDTLRVIATSERRTGWWLLSGSVSGESLIATPVPAPLPEVPSVTRSVEPLWSGARACFVAFPKPPSGPLDNITRLFDTAAPGRGWTELAAPPADGDDRSDATLGIGSTCIYIALEQTQLGIGYTGMVRIDLEPTCNVSIIKTDLPFDADISSVGDTTYATWFMKEEPVMFVSVGEGMDHTIVEERPTNAGGMSTGAYTTDLQAVWETKLIIRKGDQVVYNLRGHNGRSPLLGRNLAALGPHVVWYDAGFVCVANPEQGEIFRLDTIDEPGVISLPGAHRLLILTGEEAHLLTASESGVDHRSYAVEIPSR